VGDSSKVILNLSAIDYGGAGKFAVDFHHLMLGAGYQSYMVVKESKTNEPEINQYETTMLEQPIGKLLRKIRKRSWGDDIFSYDFYFYNKYERYSVVSAQNLINTLPAIPDIIFLHWVTDFVNAKLVHDLKRLTNAKIYWLLIDNAPLTGGCHYPWNCQEFEQNCDNCPAILSAQYKWIAKENLAFRRKYLPADMGVIAFSKSDYERAQKSALFRDKQIVKLFGYVDETVFKPGNKVAARTRFGLPENKKIIFFGASSLKEKRKGMQLLLESLALLENDDFHLLIAGSGNTSITSLPATHVGHLTEYELVTAYQAADVFVCPSIEDSGPIMINQALMCGTPVVAFDTGVAQDLVINGETGYIAAIGDIVGMANGMARILGLTDHDREKLFMQCADMATRMYSKNVLIKELRTLIEV
jgi:glycosyltransferase involved in cell wall biosynthesis